MVPVIALVGRPNVGKSTLFNCLTASRNALVADQEGVTRDRQFGQGNWNDIPYIVVDTGGMIARLQSDMQSATVKQSLLAVKEADAIFFVVDARIGITADDLHFAQVWRKQQKPVFLVVNKVDNTDPEVALADFYKLGFECYGVTASHNRGIGALLEAVLPQIVKEDVTEIEVADEGSPKVAIIGRPNVGKSTLTNRMLGQERVIVCDEPGTTRDSIYISLSRFNKKYTLIDTAGVRKKKSAMEVVEKFSVIKTLQAIKDAHVVLLLFNAREGLTDQDLTLIEFVIEAGRALIICANQWDGMEPDDRMAVKKQLSYRLKFAHFAPIHFISALHGTGVGELFTTIDKVYQSTQQEMNATKLSNLLEKALIAHSPPLVRGRRIKLRYAHCGGHHPPTIVIHGNQTDDLPLTYKRYLANYFIKALKLVGTPVRIVCRTGENPYRDKKNELTKRQVAKRKRLIKHVKS